MADWFERWKTRNPSDGLSREITFAVNHSTLAIIELVEYLLTKEDIEFVPLELIQSDYLEGRYGWFRLLNGGNYYASVLQFLQAEKTIRLRSFLEYRYNMSEINTILSEVSLARDLEDQKDATDLLVNITDLSFSADITLSQANQAIIFFLAGYIARSI